MFISPAFAQAAGGAGGGGGFEAFLPLILIFVVFYFLLIRPQQKKAKLHQAMLSSVKRGDKVVTSGGIIGTVTKVSGDDELVLEIAEGVKVRVMRGMIQNNLTNAQPAPSSDAGSDNSDAGSDGGSKPATGLKKLFGGK